MTIHFQIKLIFKYICAIRWLIVCCASTSLGSVGNSICTFKKTQHDSKIKMNHIIIMQNDDQIKKPDSKRKSSDILSIFISEKMCTF